MTDVALAGLSIADPPERWSAIGFTVGDGQTRAGAVTITLGIAPPGEGIVGWSLRGAGEGDVAGLRTRWVAGGDGAGAPVGDATGAGIAAVDHVVVATPDFDGVAAELARRGIGLRRIAEIRGTRMGFRRLGGPILEVVEAPRAPRTGFWGVTFSMSAPPGAPGGLDALRALSRFVGEPRPAVQPGRRIATVAPEAGLSARVAFIDPEPA